MFGWPGRAYIRNLRPTPSYYLYVLPILAGKRNSKISFFKNLWRSNNNNKFYQKRKKKKKFRRNFYYNWLKWYIVS